VTQVYLRIDQRDPLPGDLINYHVPRILSLALSFYYARGRYTDRDRTERSRHSQPSQRRLGKVQTPGRSEP